MKFIIFLGFFVTTVANADCRWKENCNCPVPGSTEKWHLSYCSYKVGSEDGTGDAVKECMKKTTGIGKDSCAENAYWKAEMCKMFHKNDAVKEERCNKKFYIPKLVGT